MLTHVWLTADNGHPARPTSTSTQRTAALPLLVFAGSPSLPSIMKSVLPSGPPRHTAYTWMPRSDFHYVCLALRGWLWRSPRARTGSLLRRVPRFEVEGAPEHLHAFVRHDLAPSGRFRPSGRGILMRSLCHGTFFEEDPRASLQLIGTSALVASVTTASGGFPRPPSEKKAASGGAAALRELLSAMAAAARHPLAWGRRQRRDVAHCGELWLRNV